MVKVFIDSNILVSYLTKRDKDQFELASGLIDKIRIGKMIPYVSSIVFLEVYFVMVSVYKFDKKEILGAIGKFTRMRNLVILEKTNSNESLKCCLKYNVKLSDCFIATQIPSGVKMCTFDQDFKKFPFLEIANLNEIISLTS